MDQWCSGSARLISIEAGIAPAAASVALGLALEFGDRRKGYWRTRGEVGLALAIDWAGCSNLSSADILWPAPERFEAFGIENFGYANQVVLPIRATLEAAGDAFDVHAQVSRLICSDVCTPHDFDVSLALPEGVGNDTGSAGLIARFVDRVPATADDIEISVVAIDDKPSALTVAARSKHTFRDIDVFPEFGPLVTFGKPDIRPNRN